MLTEDESTNFAWSGYNHCKKGTNLGRIKKKAKRAFKGVERTRERKLIQDEVRDALQ